jgi:hypothetical protein
MPALWLPGLEAHPFSGAIYVKRRVNVSYVVIVG